MDSYKNGIGQEIHNIFYLIFIINHNMNVDYIEYKNHIFLYIMNQ